MVAGMLIRRHVALGVRFFAVNVHDCSFNQPKSRDDFVFRLGHALLSLVILPLNHRSFLNSCEDCLLFRIEGKNFRIKGLNIRVNIPCHDNLKIGMLFLQSY